MTLCTRQPAARPHAAVRIIAAAAAITIAVSAFSAYNKTKELETENSSLTAQIRRNGNRAVEYSGKRTGDYRSSAFFQKGRGSCLYCVHLLCHPPGGG